MATERIGVAIDCVVYPLVNWCSFTSYSHLEIGNSKMKLQTIYECLQGGIRLRKHSQTTNAGGRFFGVGSDGDRGTYRAKT